MTQELIQTEVLQQLEQSMQDVAGSLSATSKRIYISDAKHFAQWIQGQEIAPNSMTRSHMIAYRSYLADSSYAKVTKKRMFSVAKKLMKEQYTNKRIAEDITFAVRGFKTESDETTHTALSKGQSLDMMESIDRTTRQGKRNYAILMMLLKTGLRRAEIVSLNRKHITMRDGHHVAIVEHGKGDKLRMVKLRIEVRRALDAYLYVVPCPGPDAPLFVSIRKGDHPTGARMTGEAIEDIVKKYAPEDTDLTPHGLRATYATIALESGAPLEQVQYSLGHSDPKTTERYQRRKLNLDHNAVDYLNF